MNINNLKFLVAGANGLVGKSLVKKLESLNVKNILKPSRQELDYKKRDATYSYLKKNKPDVVLLAAAKVGGIKANSDNQTYFLYDNMEIQNNIIMGSHLAGINNLIFYGSSCIYPRVSKQPIKENYLLSGKLEPTNEAYALSKITGLKLCSSLKREFSRNYTTIMPCNLYGPNDNFDLTTSHFIPAIIRKIHEAKISNSKKIILWGDGTPLREFLFVDDLAEATIKIITSKINYDFINVGSGEEITILEATNKIKRIIDWEGVIEFDTTKPNGTPRKLLDSSLINKFWKPTYSFDHGIKKTYKSFLENYK